MAQLNSIDPPSWYSKIAGFFYSVLQGARKALKNLAFVALMLLILLILAVSQRYEPGPVLLISQNAALEYKGPITPADFTPVASPPPVFAQTSPVAVMPSPEATPTVASEMLSEGADEPKITLNEPVATAIPLDAILAQEGGASNLKKSDLVTILLLGMDARPEQKIGRTDSLIVAVLNIKAQSVTLISLPRDLWVLVPGYGQSRINTAYFFGQTRSNGPEVARKTVSQVLGIPIDDSVVINFDGFRRMVDALDGINVNVPEAIDDPLFPDDSYGTYRLIIPEGRQHMNGDLALAYARTRHGNSDIHRAERQQAIIKAIWWRLTSLEQLPALPTFLKEGTSEIQATLSLSDLFFLARFARGLESNRIYTHVIRAPLLWNGTTADGQMVLLYDPYSLQQTVQQWLYDASLPPENKEVKEYR